jgi:hypothetical protein
MDNNSLLHISDSSEKKRQAAPVHAADFHQSDVEKQDEWLVSPAEPDYLD